ncbi:16S rRNA (uracil(1498)-N(3))-methyltransferase [bacterium]|nr:16S rRNA (uracil(1498)-N(3))-methyltransferase [bacterium]MBO5446984.1 16S rRNA (uracil(1498)-N(3))-methyltransferase [bacterium]
MPHFFINSKQVVNNVVEVSDKENYQHIAKSLRARVGETLLLIDENQIQYETTISEITNSKVLANVDNSYQSKRFLDFELYLAQSPLRSDAQNLIIEKATELGVAGVYPIMTDNCSLNKSVVEKKVPKWQRVMYESSKQCERAVVPTCYDATSLEKVLSENSFDKVIVFCERIADKTIRESFKEKPIKKGDKVLVVIGPEGGFSQKEFDSFKEKSLEMLTLGDLILRAETAVVVALGNVIYEYSNFNR